MKTGELIEKIKLCPFEGEVFVEFDSEQGRSLQRVENVASIPTKPEIFILAFEDKNHVNV